MNTRIPLIATLLLVLASQDALAGIPSTVAIAVDTSNLSPKVAEEVQDGIATHVLTGLTQVLSAFAATDISLVPVSEPKTLEQVLECEGIECLQDLAQSAKVDVVVQARVRAKPTTKKSSKRSKGDYLIAMVVVRAVPERDAWVEKTDCHACEASEVKHTASLLASMIAERIKVKKALPTLLPEVAPTPAPEPAPPPAPSPSPSPALENRPSPAAPARASVPRHLSLTALGGGVLLIGSGIYLIHLHGQGTCDLTAGKALCAHRYNTQNLGIGLVAGGGLAALAGLVGWIAFSPSTGSTHMALNLNASSISISGDF